MAANYPGSVYSPRTKENKAGVVYDSAKKTIGYAEDVVKLDEEVVAIETELGTNPKGSFSDVKSRLAGGKHRIITFIIDGGGAAITAGEKGHLVIPIKFEILEATLLADQSGSIVIDIWKDTYANFPPTNADSITAAAPPTITAAIKSKDTTLTGWSKTLLAGDVLAFNVDSCATIERVTLTLKIKLAP